jgi:hypothetical protein
MFKGAGAPDYIGLRVVPCGWIGLDACGILKLGSFFKILM